MIQTLKRILFIITITGAALWQTYPQHIPVQTYSASQRSDTIQQWLNRAQEEEPFLLSESDDRTDILPLIQVGIIIDGPWERNDQVISLLKQEIKTLTQHDFTVLFPHPYTIEADWSIEKVHLAIDKLMNDPDVDLVIGVGILSSHALCRRNALPKPAIASIVLDPQMQGIPASGNSSGTDNLSYVTFPASMSEGIETFRRIVPFKKAVFIANPAIFSAIPSLSENLLYYFHKQGLELQIIPAKDPPQAIINTIPNDADAAIITSQFQWSNEEFGQLAQGLINRNLPTFSTFGKGDVERGILLSLASTDIDIPRIIRRVALNVQRILLGEKAQDLPVLLPRKEQITINIATAEKIGIYPSREFLIDAEVIGDTDISLTPRVSLIDITRQVLNRNLALLSKKTSLESHYYSIRQARSQLFPHIEIGNDWVNIDSDRARAGFGLFPQASSTFRTRLQQIIFSEKLLTQVDIQKYLSEARTQELEKLKLDIILAVSQTYFNVLRAQTILNIQKDNLKLSHSHLKLARSRQSVGYSSPAEVYRWESEIATNKKNVLNAQTQLKIAQMELNRLLHRPLEEPIEVRDVTLTDDLFALDEKSILDYIDDMWSFKIFRDFMVAEGINSSVELKQIQKLIAVKERQIKSSQRAFWSPTVTFGGTVEEHYHTSGQGTDSPLEKDDTDLSAILSVSLPLFEGGRKEVIFEKDKKELDGLHIQRDIITENISQRIRTAIQQAGTAYLAIDLARQAETAAHKNLELVIDSYAHGAVSIIELLDAQNAAVVSEQVATDSLYDFFINFMEANRAIGKFYFLADEAERQELRDKLVKFNTQSGFEKFIFTPY